MHSSRRCIALTVITCAIFSISCDNRRSRSGGGGGADLAAARAGHSTKLTRSGTSPQEYQDQAPPPDVRVVEYMSGPLKLKAWLTPDPRSGKKFPAVVYVHGGFGFGRGGLDGTQPYCSAGFVVMTPTLPGEKGNAGRFGRFYGEG